MNNHEKNYSEDEKRFVHAAQLIADIIHNSAAGLNYVNTETYRAYLIKNTYNGEQYE